jgi:predicted nucleic acid-binding Zn ribbon protein
MISHLAPASPSRIRWWPTSTWMSNTRCCSSSEMEEKWTDAKAIFPCKEVSKKIKHMIYHVKFIFKGSKKGLTNCLWEYTSKYG